MSSRPRSVARSCLVALALVVVAAACTSDDPASEGTTAPSTSAPPPTTVATTLPPPSTTTTQPASLDELLRATLSPDDFSATIAADTVQSQRIGVITGSGSGAVVGADSSFELASDYTGLDGTYFESQGRIVGPDGLTEISQASVYVDGVLYRQDDGGRWRIWETGAPDTSLGHIFASLRDVAVFEETGSEVINGNELTIMQPEEPVEYDPRFFDFNPDTVLEFTADTSVLVDEQGSPEQIRLIIDAEIESGTTTLPTVFDLTFQVSDIGSTSAVQAPHQAWVTLTSHGFRLTEDVPAFVDMEVPADWVVVALDDLSIVLDSPSGVRVIAGLYLSGFAGLNSPEKTSVDESFPQVLASVEVDPDEVTEPEYSVFPSRFATQEDQEYGYYLMVYHEVNFGEEWLTVLWIGPLDGLAEQQADFEEILSTVTWQNLSDDGFLPGETLADGVLQSDTLDALLPAVAAQSGCDEPLPAWTDLVSGGIDTWTEDWYLNTCGTIEIYEITFAESPQGGIDIAFAVEPRQHGEQP